MKKLAFTFLAVLAVSASCSKMEEKNDLAGGQQKNEAELGVNQILCSIPLTRTSIDADLNVIWSEGDEIMVFGESRASKYLFASFPDESDKKTAVFENAEPKIGGKIASIYPASAYIAESYNGTTAKITLGGVDDVNIPTGSPADVLGKTNVSSLPLVAAGNGSTLSFGNLFGGIMFRPYDYMGTGVKIQQIMVESTDGKALAGTATVDLSTGKITSFEGTETCLTFKYGDTNITSKKGFIAYLPAGDYAGLVITAIDNMGRKFPVTTGAIQIKAGTVSKLPELPLTIWYGNANCIVVKPGTTSVEIDVTPKYSWKSDYDATSGKVIRTTNNNMSELGNGVRVIWQQEEGSTLTDLTTTNTTSGTIINGNPTIDLRLSEGKGTVTVPLTGAKGNAVIGLTSKITHGTTLVWSYHIWVSDVNDIACSTSAGNYTILDRNIGATSVDGSLNSYGVNYQWGRKDPFPRDFSAQSGTSANGDLLKTAERTTSTTVAYSILNPDTRVIYTQNTSGAKWLPVSLNGLWGYAEVHGSSTDALKVKNTVKTVYDPCPAGYKVPALVYLTSIGSLNDKSDAVVSEGYYMSTGSSSTFFPYGGYVRVCKTTKANDYQMYRGYIWSAVNRSDSQGAYIFRYNQDGIQQNKNSIGANIYTFCGDALPVRCIKE